jgi:CheY-like chemotaxis protein
MAHNCDMNFKYDFEPVLIIEANDDDALLFRKALEKAGVDNPIRTLADGREAIAYLNGAGPYGDRRRHPLPSIIYTALNLPNKNGFAVLDWLNQHPERASIPVIVMSWSADEEDVQKAYEMGANSYMVKPGTFQELIHSLRAAAEYWQCCFKQPLNGRC